MKLVGYTKWVGGLSSQWKIIKVYHFLSGLWLSKLRQSFWLWKSLQDKLFPKRFENLTQTKSSLQIRSNRPGQIGLSKIWVRYESYLALDVLIFESLKTKNLNGNLLHQWKKPSENKSSFLNLITQFSNHLKTRQELWKPQTRSRSKDKRNRYSTKQFFSAQAIIDKKSVIN